MSVLSAGQRKALSDVVADAREVVEAACAQRIAALAVAADRAPDTLSDDERRLRRGLRARARQLGTVDALINEAGFEHWHRMLFTRYLADNNLLVDDQSGQPVTIDEVAQYAAELGEPDMWEVAARFAAAMLPGLFRRDDPVLRMRLPVETRQRLEDLLSSLPADVITAEDSLGWVYQYWQARRKDEVNRSESKIGGAVLAPVTQLFTENYMVRFLLENSLGAWWATRYPDSPLLAGWEYLRFADDGTPAAGTFDEWPRSAAEITFMDPCCGSGHFLVAKFGMLWRMRAEEEGLETAAAQNAVLHDNLFGLELDPRCTQIATFALALEAWKTGGYRPLPLPNIACSGIPTKAPLSEWATLAGGDPQLEAALSRLHTLFANADTLGSLIDPIRAAEQAGLESVDWHTIAPLFTEAVNQDTSTPDDPASAVFGEAATGIARAADYLTRTYTLVATNPPYLKRGNESDVLADFCDRNYPLASGNLATTMHQRVEQLVARGGHVSAVLPQSWLLLSGYSELRRKFLSSSTIGLLAQLGTRAFSSISGEIVNVVLLISALERPLSESSYATVDVASEADPLLKATALQLHKLGHVAQLRQLDNPDARITGVETTHLRTLADFVHSIKGTTTGDDPRFKRAFWELDRPELRRLLQASSDSSSIFSGLSYVLDLDGIAADPQPGTRLQSTEAVGRQAVVINQARGLTAGLSIGTLNDQNAGILLARHEADLPAIFAYCQSTSYVESVRAIDREIKVTNQTLVKVPFDLEHWRTVAADRYPDGLPEPFSNDPTQWLFRGDPVGSTSPLQVAVARLLGYSWPEQEPDSLDELADPDGVVCLPAVGGEPPGGDRLLQILARGYTHDWCPAVLDRLLSNVGAKAGATGLTAWLRNGFFKNHCNVFSSRPFIWQIWDGTADGFSALVNYHRLDRRLLERITYDYIGNWWLGRVRSEVANDVPGAEKRLAAAEQLKDKLQLILEGEPPFDIYVRWKSPAEQPVGWHPDLDDGVRLNIRPLMAAGILRNPPNIKWNKDRGKNPDGSDRPNDLHYTIAQKRAARGMSQ
jgi:hypothetical protein